MKVYALKLNREYLINENEVNEYISRGFTIVTENDKPVEVVETPPQEEQVVAPKQPRKRKVNKAITE